MIEPKTSIYSLLSTVGTTYQAMPEIEVTYPCITFSIAEDRPEYTMDGEISHQVIIVNVDLWAETSTGTSSMLVDLLITTDAVVELGDILKYGNDYYRVKRFLKYDSHNLIACDKWQ